MDDLFNMTDIDWAGMCNYIAQYLPAKLGLMGEVKQKCFMVTADGPVGHYGYQNLTYCVFPTFIVSYMTGNGSYRAYDIEGHTLTSYDLRSLKHSKLCYYNDDMISKVLSRFQSVNQCEKSEESQLFVLRRELKKEILYSQSFILTGNTQNEIYDVHKLRQQLKKDEDEFFLKKQLLESERLSFNREKQELKIERTLFDEVFEEAKQNLRKERKAFEKAKQELEQELAKSKGIVINCQREIKAYGLYFLIQRVCSQSVRMTIAYRMWVHSIRMGVDMHKLDIGVFVQFVYLFHEF